MSSCEVLVITLEEVQMNFSSYFVLSTLVVVGIITHAYVAHEQWYPAVVYLSTDKMCLAVMYNFAFAVFLLCGKMLLRIFIGSLRDLEVEQLVDSGRGFLADTILFLIFYAPTIDNREVGTVYLIQYICCVIFMKVFHLVTQIRVSHMFEVGVPRLIVNLKLVALMGLLLLFDFMALRYFYSVASRSSTFFTWILFEALTMSTVVIVSICKYSVHMVDLRLENGWPGKSVCLFYIDLVHDVVSMTLFLVFMLTFFVQNPSRLPIYMMADVIQVARKLAQRLRSFRRYRRISNNMEVRFADATDEEIQANEQCVICRDSLFDGSKAKKLSCGHIFHIDCLRSWFVMQQVCPTCRAEIPADGPAAGSPTRWFGAAGAPEVADAARADAPAAGAAAVAATPAVEPAAAPRSDNTSAAPAVSTRSASSARPPPAADTDGSQSGSVPQGANKAPAPQATSSSKLAGSSEETPCASGAAASQAAAPSKAANGMPASSPTNGGADVGSQAQNNTMGTLGSISSVSEINETLKRAEEISKFLRQQSEFWMEQVRIIQQSNTQEMVGAPGWPGFLHGYADHQNVAASWLQSPLLSPGGQFSFPGVASAGPSRAPDQHGTPGSAEQPRTQDQAVSANSCQPDAAEGSCGSGGVAAQAQVRQPAVTESTSTTDLDSQMAQLRRAQTEKWERSRTAGSSSSGAPAS